MSIKSLFEDIADAIREKSGSSDTYTPAEMPSAIRSIPSGSSSASGVTYDNTTSGLSATNVQDAIDEVVGDVTTINSDLSELRKHQLDVDNRVDFSSYTAFANTYTVPKDGIIRVDINSVASNHCAAGFSEGVTVIDAYGSSSGKTVLSFPVRSGQGVCAVINSGSGNSFYYYPFK